MTNSELVNVMEFLHGCYPALFGGMEKPGLERMITSWGVVFRDAQYTEERVMEGAKRHVMGERGRFLPTPRDILELMPAYSSPEKSSESSDALSS